MGVVTTKSSQVTISFNSMNTVYKFVVYLSPFSHLKVLVENHRGTIDPKGEPFDYGRSNHQVDKPFGNARLSKRHLIN